MKKKNGFDFEYGFVCIWARERLICNSGFMEKVQKSRTQEREKIHRLQFLRNQAV